MIDAKHEEKEEIKKSTQFPWLDQTFLWEGFPTHETLSSSLTSTKVDRWRLGGCVSIAWTWWWSGGHTHAPCDAPASVLHQTRVEIPRRSQILCSRKETTSSVPGYQDAIGTVHGNMRNQIKSKLAVDMSCRKWNDTNGVKVFLKWNNSQLLYWGWEIRTPVPVKNVTVDPRRSGKQTALTTTILETSTLWSEKNRPTHLFKLQFPKIIIFKLQFHQIITFYTAVSSEYRGALLRLSSYKH